MSAVPGTTYISDVTGGANVPGIPVAPGGAGVGGTMSMRSAILWVIGGAAVISLSAGYVGRKGKAPTIGHLDVIDSAFNAATVVVWIGTFKLLAYKYHGHKISQAFLQIV